MNNMIFPICLYLLDAGYDVTLFYLDEFEHFKPSKKHIPTNLDIVDLGWNEKTFSKIPKKYIKSIFRKFDFFIGTDYSVAYLSKANIKIDIYMPAGSDLYDWPFRSFNRLIPESWEINKVRCSKHQNRGIRQAKYFSLDYTNKKWEEIIEKFFKSPIRVPVLPFLYFKDFKSLLSFENQIDVLLNPLENFIILQHSRQSWNYIEENDHNKGNDKLIEGFAKFSQNIKNSKLALFEYGSHVNESKELINDLGISDKVIWLPKMNKDKVLLHLKYANISVGNLKKSYISYGAVYEALACKVAFMGYRKDSLYENDFPELYPMINVKTPEEIANKLEYYYYHRDELTEMGEKGYHWLLNYAIKPSVDTVLDIIQNHKGRKKLPPNWELIILEPYFWFIRFYNIFRVKLRKWVKI